MYTERTFITYKLYSVITNNLGTSPQCSAFKIKCQVGIQIHAHRPDSTLTWCLLATNVHLPQTLERSDVIRKLASDDPKTRVASLATEEWKQTKQGINGSQYPRQRRSDTLTELHGTPCHANALEVRFCTYPIARTRSATLDS